MTYSVPGIFNVEDYMIYTSGNGGTASSNTTYLQQLISQVQGEPNPNGAVILFPSYNFNSLGSPAYGVYPIGSSTGGTVINIPAAAQPNAPLTICGTGLGTTLDVRNGSSEDNILFNVAEGAIVIFQDLTVVFNSSHSQKGVAFAFNSGSGHKLFRVNVTNCQSPVTFQGSSNVAIRQCQFEYSKDDYDGSISSGSAITIDGSSSLVSIAACVVAFYADKTNVANYIGIDVGQASNISIRDTQCNGLGTGLSIGGGSSTAVTSTVKARCVRVSSDGPCVEILNSAYDVNFVGCHFQAGTGYAGSGPGVVIGSPGGDNAQIDTIRFTSCSLSGDIDTVAYGLAIYSGQNIQIVGGHYAGNGMTGGITVQGNATEVQIIGASSIGLYYGPPSSPLYQLYGIYVSAGRDIQIIGANCSGCGIPGGSPSDSGAGIYIDSTAGAIANVKVIGAICTNPVLQEGDSMIFPQEYGIYASGVTSLLVAGCNTFGNASSGIYLDQTVQSTISGCDLFGNTQGLGLGSGCEYLFVRDCNFDGYDSLAGAITFPSGALTGVEVTDCHGYNDVATAIYGPGSPPSGVFNGVLLAGYYGPTVFYYSGTGGDVSVGGLTPTPTRLPNGGFTLVLRRLRGDSGWYRRRKLPYDRELARIRRQA